MHGGDVKMILLLAGTSDARELALKSSKLDSSFGNGRDGNGGEKLSKMQELHAQVGRLTAAEMASLIIEKGFQAVVDASHPFAEEASKNALQGCKEANVPYIRYERESQRFQDEKLIMVVIMRKQPRLLRQSRVLSC